MTQRADDGPPTTRRDMSDAASGVGKERKRSSQLRVGVQFSLAHHGADHDAIRLFSPMAEFFYPGNIHDDRRTYRPQIHHRHQALAARDHPAILAKALHQRDCLVDAARGGIFERCRFHWDDPLD